MTYRSYANNSARYQAKLRDRQINQVGVRAWIRERLVEGRTDFYGDPIVQFGPRREIYLIPLYDQYYNVVDLMGSDIELNLPLQAIARVHDHIPNESVVQLDIRNDEGKLVHNWWTVNSSKIKHLERRYTRMIYLSPTREPVEEFTREATLASFSNVTVTATVIHGP